MSAPSVHSICGEIRRMRKKGEEKTANFPPMTLAACQTRMETRTHLRLQSE